MGAYQNPEQVKDYTMDVANAWANATNKVVKGLTDIADDQTVQYKANEKKYNENLLAAQKLKVQYASKVGDVAEGYAGADLRKTFSGKADEYANIQLRLMNNTSEDVKADMEELERLDRLPGQAKTAIATLMSQKEAHNKSVALAGQPGGYDKQNININDPANSTFNGLNSIYGNAPAKQDIALVADANGNYSLNFNSEGMNGEWKSTINSSTSQQMQLKGTSILPTIPDAAAALNESLTATDIYGKVKKVDKSGKTIEEIVGAADNFYEKKWEDDPKYVEGKINQNYTGTLQYKDLADNIQTQSAFTAKVAGYLANPDQVAALMNSTGFQDPNKPVRYTASQFAEASVNKDDPMAIKFKEALANYFAHTFPPKRQMVNEAGEPIVQIKAADVTTDVERAANLANPEKPFIEGDTRKVMSKGKKWSVTKDKNGKATGKVIK